MARSKTIADDDLLDALRPVLLKQGLHRATLAQLGTAVGLAPATLLQRFGSRRGLVDAVLDRATEQLACEIEAAPSDVPLVDWLAGRWRDLDDRELLAGGLQVLGRDFTVAERRRVAGRHQALIRERIRRGLDAMGLDASPASIRLVEAHWHGLVIQWGLDGDGRLEAFVANGLRRLLCLLGGPVDA